MPIWTPQDERRKQFRLRLDALGLSGRGGALTGAAIGGLVVLILVASAVPLIGGLLLTVGMLAIGLVLLLRR